MRLVLGIVGSLWNLTGVYRGVCQTSKRHFILQYRSRGFDILWDLMIRQLVGYWNESMESSDHRKPLFYQTRSAWSVDQGSTRKCSAVHNFAPTVMKFCVMWEGLFLPHDTKFSNCRDEIVDRRVIFIWSLIHGSGWSGLIKQTPSSPIMSSILYVDFLSCVCSTFQG